MLHPFIHLDVDAYIENEHLKMSKIKIVIVGSSVLVSNNIHIKETEDIDIIKISSYISEELLRNII